MSLEISLSFFKHSDALFLIDVQRIIDGLTGNTHFTEPTPTLLEINAAKTAFSNAFAGAPAKGHQGTAAKDKTRATLEDLIRKLSKYVELNSQDDVTILLSSGFTLQKDPEAHGALEEPNNFKVRNGVTSGTMDLSVDPIPGAYVYYYLWAQLPVAADAIWASKVGKASVTIEGLTPGKEYAFKVCGVGSSDERVFSAITNHFVA
jgi:hypothetical protein